MTELFQCDKDLFCTSIGYVDRYLSTHRVTLAGLQLLGAAALMVACKTSGAPLAVDDLCVLMDNVFSPAELKVRAGVRRAGMFWLPRLCLRHGRPHWKGHKEKNPLQLLRARRSGGAAGGMEGSLAVVATPRAGAGDAPGACTSH